MPTRVFNLSAALIESAEGRTLIKPLKAAMWVTVEVILGYIMLGGLITIFASKLSRRGG